MANETQPSQRIARMKFAESLAEFNTQRDWYDKKASQFKSKAQKLDLLVLMCGALVAALPILKPGADTHWSEIMVSFLGAAIVLGQGSQRVFRFGDVWPEYRSASERMKREWRLFINGNNRYATDDATAKSQYITQLDSIIAEESKLFFDKVDNSTKTETQ